MQASSRFRALLLLSTLTFLTLFTLWAPAQQPTTSITPEEAFKKLATYDYDQGTEILVVLNEHIARNSSDSAKRPTLATTLAGIVSGKDTPLAAKLFACKQLALVGDPEQVPTLIPLLRNPETTAVARRALQCIPGDATREAFRGALTDLNGTARIEIIQALGDLKDIPSSPALARQLRDENPEIAREAARALSLIASPESAKALCEFQPSRENTPAFVQSLLDCADRIAHTNGEEAARLYEVAKKLDNSDRTQLAVLAGLVRVRQSNPTIPSPLPQLLQAIQSGQPVLQAIAIRKVPNFPEKDSVEAFGKTLETLSTEIQPLLIEALSERPTPETRALLRPYLTDPDETVQTAAVAAFSAVGTAEDVKFLAELAASQSQPVSQAARKTLARIQGKDIDSKIAELARSETSAVRAELLRALTARQAPQAGGIMLEALSDTDPTTREVAWEALATLQAPDVYTQVIRVYATLKDDAEIKTAQRALNALGTQQDATTEKSKPVREALQIAEPEAKPLLLALLPGVADSAGLAVLTQSWTSPDANTRDAAIRALANWPDAEAGKTLLEVAQKAESDTHRTLALRAYLRLASSASTDRVAKLESAKKIANTPESRKLLLSALSGLQDTDALGLAVSMLGDADTQAETEQAILTIAGKTVSTEKSATAEALQKLVKTSQNADVLTKARELLQKALQPVSPLDPAPYDEKTIESHKQEIARQLPPETTLAAYLDCGAQTATAPEIQPRLQQINGNVYAWPVNNQKVAPPLYTAGFSAPEVTFEATGLKPDKHYAVGFSWLDTDGNGRVQAVTATGADKKSQQLLEATKLPSGQDPNARPATARLPLPLEMTKADKVRISFQAKGPSNAICNEIWLVESDQEITRQDPATAPENRRTRLLIVTGQDYPGHKWRQTTPCLRKVLEADPRFTVSVVEDPQMLDSTAIHQYDAIILHFMNWETTAPDQKARENLQRFVENGKGLVLLHFACGAFNDWPEFEKLAGRVYDPKLRGHDPWGAFRVEITNSQHPAARGLQSFDTQDELYTCAAGTTPIEVVASARSKVDNKDYPIAFVLNPGKGRSFHCLLGHDEKAFESAGVGELLRKGCAWAAGLDFDSK